MKSIAATTLAILLTLSGAALAQTSTSSGAIAPGSANGQRNGDAPGTNTVPGAPPSTAATRAPAATSGSTGTLSDKNAGPSGATGNSPGPDGTPGNGSPAKQDGNQR